jgi:predicted ArsR family transcriptional regulator
VGSDELEGLRRAESQRGVLMCLIETGEPMSSQDISEKLGITVNAVNIALFQLNKKELVDRVSRGVYRYQMGPILLTLLKEYFSR